MVGKEQEDADHRAHIEIHLADDLAVDFGGEDRVIAADGRGVAEIGDRHREHDEAGAEKTELDVRKRDVEELSVLRRSQHLGGLVDAGIRRAQRRADDENRLRQRIKSVGDQQSPEAIDVDVEAGELGDDAVAPEQENQSQSLHERGRQQWQRNGASRSARPGTRQR